ncbi:MAG: Holliday junction DNA helicase RuvA [Desulfobacteraceae bacterium]|nr:Holliday junction DNA helicase RuvA [Desulfobacteraceae bacterium]
MIGYLEGKLLKKEDERILLLANQVGYEILLPAFVADNLKYKGLGDQVSLFIYFYQTDRQPKPVLIGFHLEAEKEFFQHFISVDAIGPLKAAKALSVPISDIARAIESGQVDLLKRLKGIGVRSAQKIIATLQGKVSKFALIRNQDVEGSSVPADFMQPVLDVLTVQLGHRQPDAKNMIKKALERNPAINSPEALFDEIYKGDKL